MLKQSRAAAFSLPELLVGMGIAGVISAGIVSFLFVSSRLAARNLAVNHSHLTVRQANQRLGAELHEACSGFRLFDCTTSTTFTDVTAVPTSDTDSATGEILSTSAGGVRFRAPAGGPYRLGANAASDAKTLTFTMAGAPDPSYVPEVGDKIYIPLIRKELDITGVIAPPSEGVPTFTVTTAQAIGYAFSRTEESVTAAYFLRKVGFSVFNNELRFHKRFPGESSDIVVVCGGVTSPKPFALLCPGGTPDDLAVRVSLEAHDRDYTNRKFQGGTVTLQSTYSPRTAASLLVQTN
jgi:type II secretory pathway pseudopilin PulG